MEHEYIKREAAIDAVTAVYVRTAGYKTRERVWETREAIQKLPAADVTPVVHGHFVHDGPRFAGGVDWWHCSSCGKLAAGVETRFNYCPRCGARMDGGACNQECKYNTPDRGCIAKTIGARCDLENAAGKRGGGEAG